MHAETRPESRLNDACLGDDKLHENEGRGDMNG